MDNIYNAGAAIGELRRLSGLTWEQLSSIFAISRRSLHLWASGKLMIEYEDHLQRVLDVVRKIDRGCSNKNRAALFSVLEGEETSFDLLIKKEYEKVIVLLGEGCIKRVSVPKLSKEERDKRVPPPPWMLIGALQDRIHTNSKLLQSSPVAKSIKYNSSGKC